VSNNVPANTTAELIAWTKAQKGKANCAVAAGTGSATPLAGMVATLPHVKAGKIKLIAVSSDKRNPVLGAQVPTVAESVPGFLTGSWQGLLAPAGTPKTVVDKVHAEVMRIIALPDVRERLATLGADPVGLSPADFGNWLKAEVPAMARIVRDEKITAE
jgi:tripartite-type tricarboxylate transporter receptor subunit TctC